MNAPIDPVKLASFRAKLREVQRRKERERQTGEGGFLNFVRYFWDVLEPNTKFVEGWVIETICAHLEAIAFGDVTRLLIIVPPGFCKSLLTDVFFPAWLWGPCAMPDYRIVAFSYSASLTERDNGKFRDLLMSDKFQDLWGERFTLRKIGETKVSNNRTGWKLASSVGGVGTGERGDMVICLPYEEKVLTTLGWLPIGDIVSKKLPVKIGGLSDAGTVEWQAIEEYEQNPGRELVEIAWDSGTLRCTGDHPVFIEGRGYIPASEIKAGDVLWSAPPEYMSGVWDLNKTQAQCSTKVLQLRLSLCSGHSLGEGAWEQTVPSLRGDGVQNTQWLEAGPQSLLHTQVSGEVLLRPSEPPVQGRTSHSCLSSLQQALLSKTGLRQNGKMLFNLLRSHVQQPQSGIQAYNTVSRLWEAHTSTPRKARSLFSNLRKQSSLSKSVRTQQWTLRTWEQFTTLSSWLVASVQTSYPRTRREPLPTVLEAPPGWTTSVPRASYRLREREPGLNEPNHSLSLGSRGTSREPCATPLVERKIVRAVRSAGWVSTTYNVRVAPHHNYFASGILTHNCDDPHSIKQAESETVRTETVRWFREAMSNRLNDMENSCIVVIMQRSHEEDVAGVILDNNLGYCILCIDMEYDPTRQTAGEPNAIGWVDPRQEDGELAWPERFSERVCVETKNTVGPYAWAAQYQQMPAPRGGGIIKRDWWQLWDEDEARKYNLQWDGTRREFPHFELVIGSLDTSYGEKQENDFNALTIWGIWTDLNKNRRAMMAYAWNKRLPLHGKVIEALPNEPKEVYQARLRESWGLVEWVADTCKRYRVKRLLIEDKTRGRDVAQELRRLYKHDNWGVELINPTIDKVSRTHAIVPLFTDNCVWTPETKWSEQVLTQCATFPKAAHDDLHDTVVQVLAWARANGILLRGDEASAALEEEAVFHAPLKSVASHYGV